MNTNMSTPEAHDVDVERVLSAIKALQPGKLKKKTQLFQQFYPEIERALARDVPQKELVDMLKKEGLPMSMGGFRTQLEAERKRRHDGNDLVICDHCGSTITPSTEECTSQTHPMFIHRERSNA